MLKRLFVRRELQKARELRDELAWSLWHPPALVDKEWVKEREKEVEWLSQFSEDSEISAELPVFWRRLDELREEANGGLPAWLKRLREIERIVDRVAEKQEEAFEHRRRKSK